MAKAVAVPGHIREGVVPCSATFSQAQALVSCLLLHRKQNRFCASNEHGVIFFSSDCILRGRVKYQPGNHTRTSRAHHQVELRFNGDDMNASLIQGSARIYQFPQGGRASLGGRRYDEAMTPAKQTGQSVQMSICCDSWYHEAAIQDAKPAWER